MMAAWRIGNLVRLTNYCACHSVEKKLVCLPGKQFKKNIDFVGTFVFSSYNMFHPHFPCISAWKAFSCGSHLQLSFLAFLLLFQTREKLTFPSSFPPITIFPSSFFGNKHTLTMYLVWQKQRRESEGREKLKRDNEFTLFGSEEKQRREIKNIWVPHKILSPQN